jgi:hypothetical protein
MLRFGAFPAHFPFRWRLCHAFADSTSLFQRGRESRKSCRSSSLAITKKRCETA